MTPEQIKEIEREAEAFMDGDFWFSYQPSKAGFEGYIAGATAQLEKFPCSPEDAREAIRMAKSLFNIVESHAGRSTTCPYCGDLTWTVKVYGRIIHKQFCPHRIEWFERMLMK